MQIHSGRSAGTLFRLQSRACNVNTKMRGVIRARYLVRDYVFGGSGSLIRQGHLGKSREGWHGNLEAMRPTKLPAHLRQVKQLSLTRLFSAESLGFPRSREEERALCLPKEQGRVCTLPCLREGSFTLQDGAHFWSLHPPPALNISSPTPDMFAISQNSFMPDFIYY
ncbi:hypothetical protein T06_15285 [Trichinella sp. T6]|nr:hypothetical protein T06_15285 [Trichinella sp. T6]